MVAARLRRSRIPHANPRVMRPRKRARSKLGFARVQKGLQVDAARHLGHTGGVIPFGSLRWAKVRR